MRRFPVRMQLFVTGASLALVGGCWLDPESVGDESTTSVGTTATSEASEEISGTTDDPIPDDGAGELFEEWEDVELDRLLLRSSGGPVLVLGTPSNPTFDGDAIYGFELPGTFVWSGTSHGHYFDDFVVGSGGLVMSGRQDDGVDPVGAYLWMVIGEDDAEIPMYEVMLAGGSSSVVEVAVGGGMLWTLTAERTTPEEPSMAVLRRHGPEGAVELTHPLLAPSTTLAVDIDGFAYSIADGDAPQLHRVAPGGVVAWSLPAEPGSAGAQELHARPGAPGVVIVREVVGGRHVEVLDGGGVTLHEFLVSAMASALPPASDVRGDEILLAHPLPPDAYVVEARSFDGVLQWSATRTVVGATSIEVADVLEIPGGAAVVGQVERDASSVGFIRFVVAP